MAYSSAWTDALQIIADAYNTTVPNVESVLNAYDIYDDPAAALAHFRDTRYLAGMEKFNNVAANGAVQGQYLTGVGNTTTITSNSNTILRSQIRTPINSSLKTTQGVTKFSAKVGLREAGSFVFGEVVPAICAAGWGITLGKTIDRTLYKANPDFWNAHGMSSLNPETWNDITTGYDGVAGTLFDLIFGLDGNKGQAYMDENAAAYLALWMKMQGVFDGGNEDYTAKGDWNPGTLPSGYTFKYPQSNYKTSLPLYKNTATQFKGDMTLYEKYDKTSGDGDVYFIPFVTSLNGNRTNWIWHAFSFSTFTYSKTDANGNVTTGHQSSMYNYNNKTIYVTSVSASFYYYVLGTGLLRYLPPVFATTGTNLPLDPIFGDKEDVAFLLACSNISDLGPAVEGIGDQDGAQLPDTSDWTNLENTKNSLQRQYPNLWSNAKHNDYVDNDGTNKHKTYIPINLPNITDKDDTQPTSGNRSQGDPEVDPATATDTLLDNLPKLITSQPTSGTPTPTGSGSSPDVLPPSGSASSLWSVYNPTQAQVDAFGSWLWSSNLVEQIKKLFNDPMQAIIGIHKVFVTPPTSGTGTIKCGYIDSGISSALVSNQYRTLNCGTVSLSEYFGNVFDYSPFTEVSLYLPFIGIVRLDVSDVMRSSINVKYHVDVITGACLADVKVSRDGADSVLYQYAGSCIVTYPLSSGSYASALAGIVSIAGGAIGTIATGGALAPVAIGAAVGATKLHSDVQKSGSFTGAAGAMGSKKPYFIISRPQTAMPSNYKKYEGNPSRHYTTIRSCSGFIRVKDVHVDKMSASNKELDMIESLLKSGIEV